MIALAICILGITIALAAAGITAHLGRIADYLEQIKNKS